MRTGLIGSSRAVARSVACALACAAALPVAEAKVARSTPSELAHPLPLAGHAGVIGDLAWSPDSLLLAVQDSFEVRVWRARDMKLMGTLGVSDAEADFLLPRPARARTSFGNVGLQLLGFAGRDRLWLGTPSRSACFDWRSGRLVADLSGGRAVNDGRAILFSKGNRWSLFSFRHARWKRGEGALPKGATHFSEDMSRAAVPTHDSFEVWDLRTRRKSTLRDAALTPEPNGEDRLAFAPLIFSRDGSKVWTSGYRRQYAEGVDEYGTSYTYWTNLAVISEWDTRSGRRRHSLAVPNEMQGESLHLSFDERLLAVETYVGCTIIPTSSWRAQSLPSPPAGQTWRRPVSLSPDGRYLASTATLRGSTRNNSLWLWSLADSGAARPLRQSPPGADILSSLQLSPDGRSLFGLGEAGSYKWDLASRKMMRFWPLDPRNQRGWMLGPTLQASISSDLDGRLWVIENKAVQLRARDGRVLCTYSLVSGENFSDYTLLPRRDGKSLVIVFTKDTRTLRQNWVEVIAYDEALGAARLARRFSIAPGDGSKSLSPDGRLLFVQAIASGNGIYSSGTLAAYDLRSSRLVAALPMALEQWLFPVPSKDGSTVGFGGQLWRLRPPRMVVDFQDPRAILAISPDGSQALVKKDQALQLWSIEKRAPTRIWRLDELASPPATSAAFSPDGATVYVSHAGRIHKADTRSGSADVAFAVPALP